MDDALLMRGFESSGNLAGQRDGFVHRQRVPVEPFRQRRTLYQFQYETRRRMVFAFEILQAVDRTDVRMVQRREDLCLALEPRQPLGISGKGGRQDFDRHLTAEQGVCCPIHLAHPTNAEQRFDPIRAELRPHHDSAIIGQQIGNYLSDRPVDHYGPLRAVGFRKQRFNLAPEVFIARTRLMHE